MAPGITIVANCPLQLHRQIFFTDCILTGSSAPCPPPGILHAGGPASSARSARAFSYQLHFDWQPGFLPPACESGSGTVRTPARGAITVFFAFIGSQRYLAYCAPRNSAPTFSYRSHFDWAHNFPPLQRRYCWTYVRHNHSVAVRFDSKEV